MTELVDTAPVDKGGLMEDPRAIGSEAGLDQTESFVQLFASVAKQHKDRDDLPRGESPHAVGNSTAMRHRDGGPGDEGRSAEREVASADQGDGDLDDPNSGDAQSNRHQLAGWSPGDLGTATDRRVYVDCESAGLPRRELTRLARVLQNSAIAGRRAISVAIHLPELGEMRFDVRIKNKTVFIHAFVNSDRAATALALAISTLRDKLAEHDLALGRLDVTTERDQEKREAKDADQKASRSRKDETRPPWGRANEARVENENGVIHVLA